MLETEGDNLQGSIEVQFLSLTVAPINNSQQEMQIGLRARLDSKLDKIKSLLNHLQPLFQPFIYLLSISLSTFSMHLL